MATIIFAGAIMGRVSRITGESGLSTRPYAQLHKRPVFSMPKG